MRSIVLIALLFLHSCKKEPDSRSIASAPVPDSGAPRPALPASARTVTPSSSVEPFQFLPQLGLVLFGSCILVDTNGLGYPIQGSAEMLSQELAVGEVKNDALPPQWRDLIGKSFTVYTPRGEDRRVVIQSFRVLSIVNDGADAMREIWERHSDHVLSETEFRQLPAAHLLVAVFAQMDPDSSSPASLTDGTRLEWARLSSLAEPRLGRTVEHDDSFDSRMDRFIKRSAEYESIQERYGSYAQEQASKEEGKRNLPPTWLQHAKVSRGHFLVSGKEIGFVSLASRSFCGDDGFDAEWNALTWTSEIQLTDLQIFPFFATDEQRLLFAWDNEAAGDLDLLFTDGLEWISFVRVLSDGTVRSFALHIPYETLGC